MRTQQTLGANFNARQDTPNSARGIVKRMAYKVVAYKSTPNPDALKCVLDRLITPIQLPVGKLRAYRAKPDAKPDAQPELQVNTQADPLAAALLAIEGVTNVLIHDTWLTVGKSKAASWAKLKPLVEQALAQAE